MSDKQNKLNKKKEDKRLREMGYNKEELPFEVRLAEREQAPKKERAKLSPTAITAIATGAVVLALGIAFLIWFLVHNYKQDPRFDYLESDLNGYVDFSPEDYKSYKVEIDIAEPHRKKRDEGGKLTGVSDVEVAIMNLLCSKSELIDDAAQSLTATVEMGDTVYVRFRGYRLDSEGKKQHLAGLSDFTNAEPTKIAIGNNTLSMIGLDLGLIGKNQENYVRFDGKTSEEQVTENHVVYLNYKKSTDGGTAYSYSNQRIDMNDGEEKVDEAWGAGFFDFLKSLKAGSGGYSFETQLDSKKVKYTDVKVALVTLCENEDTNGDKEILTVETYYPYDYGTTGLTSAQLRNETVYFDVYIVGVSKATTPALTDDFISELLESKASDVVAADLDKYADYTVRDEHLPLFSQYGKDTLVYKYLCYVEDTLWNYYEETRNSMIEDAMWNIYLKKAEVKRYPEIKVDEIYEQYVEDLHLNYNASKEELDEDGELKYADLDAYAKSYLSLKDGEKWEDVLYEMSQNLVKERLILYYIMKNENLTPSAEELATELEAIKQEYIDEYVRQYVEAQLESDPDYDDHLTDKDKFLEDRKAELFDFYDEAYFLETTYYEHTLPTLLSYATVSDLNTRRAYPVSK